MNPDNSRIAGVLFDLDDTLIDHQGAMTTAVLNLYQSFSELSAYYPTEAVFHQRWNAAHREYYPQYLNGKLTHDEQRIKRIHSVWKEAGVELSDRECLDYSDRFLGLYSMNWRVFSDVIECLKTLKGLKIGIVTNGWSEQQRAKLKIDGLKNFFNSVVVSSEVGCAKPDKRIFEIAANQLGIQPNSVAFVVDLYDLDVLGPVNVGMRAFWLQRNSNAPSRDLHPLARRIASLSELTRELHI